MTNTKEIRTKIKSVQNTSKITKAMEMVAASKMRKAQIRMKASRPYADKIRVVAAHAAAATPDYIHPFMRKREVKNAGIILITSDKGLCGALNTNILRALTSRLMELSEKKISIKVSAIGNKGVQFLGRIGVPLISQITNLGETPHIETVLKVIKTQLDAYANTKIDVVYLAFTRFVNTMRQEAVIEELLPLPSGLLSSFEPSNSLDQNHTIKPVYSWDYVYEPDAETVLGELLLRYIETIAYQAVSENIASEQSARMVAMQAASDNAKDVISDLQLIYNKNRQAVITKELSEIVGGAAAV